MKKVVVLYLKDTDEIKAYKTCPELVLDNKKETIGIGLGASWNALAKGKGVFENKKCRILYRNINGNDG